jgi:hypothetical protein
MYQRNSHVFRQVMERLGRGEMSVPAADQIFRAHGMRPVTEYERRCAEKATAARAASGKSFHPMPEGARPSYLKQRP